jgi:RNA polymerase sigma-70 factor (ECF subfamily)
VTETVLGALNGRGVFMAVEAHGDSQALLVALQGAREGDETAFRLIYRAQNPVLLRYLSVLVGADAEDVASEAWLQISRDLRTFHGDWDGFRGWSVTIARHRALDHLRRHRRRPVAPAPVELFATELPAAHDTVEQVMEVIGTGRALRLIASLPREQGEAVMLRIVIGLDATSAGRILGRRAGAVRTAAYRGLRQLSRLLEREGEGTARAAGEGFDLSVTSAEASALKGVR